MLANSRELHCLGPRGPTIALSAKNVASSPGTVPRGGLVGTGTAGPVRSPRTQRRFVHTQSGLSADQRGRTAKSKPNAGFQWSIRPKSDTAAPGFRHPFGTSRAARTGAFSVFVVSGYMVLGVLAFWPVLPGDPNRLFGTADRDPAAWVWFFAWTAHAAVTGHNPFFTTLVMSHPGSTWPNKLQYAVARLHRRAVTLVVSPVASVTLFTGAAMPLSAASAYAVLRRWRVWVPAAALGGLAYGFSPYMVDHVSFSYLVFIPLPPIIVATLVKVLSRPQHPLRWGTALGGLIVAQFFISSEILALTATMCAVGMASCHGLLPCASPVYHPLIRKAGGPSLWNCPHRCRYCPCLPVVVPVRWSGPLRGACLAHSQRVVRRCPRLRGSHPSPSGRPVLRDLGTRLSAFAGAEDGVYVGFAVLAVLAGPSGGGGGQSRSVSQPSLPSCPVFCL